MLSVDVRRIESDPAHHLTGPFLPQTPLGSPMSPAPRPRPRPSFASDLLSARWIVEPASAFKLAAIPVLAHLLWSSLAPAPSPLRPLLFLSNKVSDSPPLYQKSFLDLLFIAYHIIVFSFIRQFITVTLAKPLARNCGIKRPAKLDRFGEQAYALVYFAIMGAWGARIMHQLPTWWYKTDAFWLDYPHHSLPPELKRYYLMHSAYWCQQLIVLLLRLEKPRKDYSELVAHHFVTLWLIGWSYLINLTYIGNAVYMSMDIPDAWLAIAKLFNYMQKENAKNVAFGVFLCVWTYFRHYLNLVILWSVWFEFDLIPASSKAWLPATGAWLAPWMKYQIFAPLLALQFLNLFWYFLMWRILIRSFASKGLEDVRSDDEDEDVPNGDAAEREKEE